MTNPEENQAYIKRAVEASIRIGIIVLMVYWCFDIASPFIPILWGIIIAIGTYPIYRWMKAKTGLSDGWTATVFTLIMLVLLITPTIFLSEAMLQNAQTLSEDLKDDTLTIPSPPENVANWPIVGEKLDKIWNEAVEDPKAFLGEYEPQMKAIANWFIKVAANVGLTVLLFVFSIIIAGVFLVKAKGGREAAVNILTRLVGERGEELTDLSRQTVTSVVHGILGIALIQTLLAGIGFLVILVFLSWASLPPVLWR
ncbi:MAG: AI-2E family transporter [Gammaproteobacteria bacterium]|nr:MAG: AI-2E family transporter [Gammaproteobacteria bacterium]